MKKYLAHRLCHPERREGSLCTKAVSRNRRSLTVFGMTWGLFIMASFECWANIPIFSVTPNIRGQVQLNQGQEGTYLYQVTNNTKQTLSGIGLHNLPVGFSVVPAATASGSCEPGNAASCEYCMFPLSLPSQSSCLVKLAVNSNQIGSVIRGGPQVCYTPERPVYCSQPLKENQLLTQILFESVPSSCEGNESNFNYELTQTMDSNNSDPGTINSWGPARNHLLLSPENPNLTVCGTTDLSNTNEIKWMRKRILTAEDLWVKQKLNYCHHHVTDFYTPLISDGINRNAIASGGGFCSNAADIMPGSYYYGQNVRWKYSGSGSETLNNWISNNYMWYGVDCSDFTSFAYNFAFGIQFNSDTGFQAGQAHDHSQDILFPNAQTSSVAHQLLPFDNTDPTSPAGVLLCKNGHTESRDPVSPDYFCGVLTTSDSNGYISVFSVPQDHPDHPKPNADISAYIHYFKPGDLIFLGFRGSDGNNPTSMVTHVVTWTGKVVGVGPDDIPASKIAPESICPNNWQPKPGDPVIIDSHYQGPDYRVFTPCFYQDHVWGVRRVIGYMSS